MTSYYVHHFSFLLWYLEFKVVDDLNSDRVHRQSGDIYCQNWIFQLEKHVTTWPFEIDTIYCTIDNILNNNDKKPSNQTLYHCTYGKISKELMKKWAVMKNKTKKFPSRNLVHRINFSPVRSSVYFLTYGL